jgi:hypothetical protein
MQVFNNKEVHMTQKNCLLQFTALDRNILDALSRLDQALPKYLDIKEPYRAVYTQDVKKDSKKQEDLNKNPYYIHYRKSLYIQNALSYPLFNTEILARFKQIAVDKKDNEHVIRNEIRRQTTSSVASEIEDFIVSVFTNFGSVGNEEEITKALVDNKDIQSYLAALKTPKTKDSQSDEYLDKLGLKQIYDELGQFVNSEDIDTSQLDNASNILKQIFTIKDDAKQPIAIGFLFKRIKDLKFNLESNLKKATGPSDYQLKYNVVAKDILRYIEKLFPHDPQALLNNADPQKISNFFRSIESPISDYISQNYRDRIDFILLLLSENMSVVGLYEKVYDRLDPKNEQPFRPDPRKPSDRLLLEYLFETENTREVSLEETKKILQRKAVEETIEMLKKGVVA